MTNSKPLPPGQIEYPSFDRFGLGLFAGRFPYDAETISIQIGGNVENPLIVKDELAALPVASQVSDFHCVTTWSVRNVKWAGIRFSDFYNQVVVPLAKPKEEHSFVVFKGQDDYACSMLLEDLMAEDVMLAHTLNGEKLGIDHGAPLRLVAPAHYGYKNVKHIHAIEFRQSSKGFRFPLPYPDLMNHPRARVAHEERARFLPLWLIRPLYKLLQPGARRKNMKRLQQFLNQKN